VSGSRRGGLLRLLDERGAASVDHVRGDLRSHLLGTEAILRGWGEGGEVSLVGLAHAVYGTAGFDVALASLDERTLVAGVAGATVEAEVYRYAACDRKVVYPQLGQPEVRWRDRFTGADEQVAAASLRTFAAVTMANEAELAQRGLWDDDPAEQEDVAGLFRSFEPSAPALVPKALALLTW
jgi:hypothetical protein